MVIILSLSNIYIYIILYRGSFSVDSIFRVMREGLPIGKHKTKVFIIFIIDTGCAKLVKKLDTKLYK